MKAKLEIRDHGLGAMLKRASEIKSAYAKVGVLADTPQGGEKHNEGEEQGPLTVAEIAAVLEYGTTDGSIPARPALRSTFDAQREVLANMGKQFMDDVIMGKKTMDEAFNLMGSKLSTETKKTITSGPGVPPPNAPSTIARKGSDRPLVDTGRLLNAFTWAIKRKGEE